ncbi:cation:proton antiporter [Candidatus Woesearchaeota archaeon]|nr:cation:proton antiporter [Candidatus Woesearchaeota archaeon]
MAAEIFIELTTLLLVTVLVSGIMRLLKQPLIIGYILTGIIVGPMALNLVKSTEAITTFGQIGIAFLLFMVGLNLNPSVIKDVGKVSLVTGIGQVAVTGIIGYGIGKLLGFSTIASLYIGVALTFSSTIIIMKLLADRKDLETLYGRISIGFLIVQDLIAIFLIMLISSMPQYGSMTGVLLSVIVRGVGILLMVLLVSFLVLPKLMSYIAKSQEFLLLFSIGWCFGIASLFSYFQVSLEAGALLAGVMLSFSPFHYEISARMKPLRDFFLVLFFILLGSQMVFQNIAHVLVPSLVFSLYILIGNPLIMIILMSLLGYTKRNSFMVGLIVAQISEFSLVLIALGVKLGHLSNDVLSLVTIVGIITIAGSSYLILYAEKIYPYCAPLLSLLERKGRKRDKKKVGKAYEIVLFGYNRIGFDILQSLKKLKKKFMVLDYDPDVIVTLTKQGYDCTYGDANDLELLRDINLSKTKMIVSTIPRLETNVLLIKHAKRINKRMIIMVVSHQIDEAMELYAAGATYVIMPHFLGGKHVSTMIEDHKLSIGRFLKEKAAHLKHLKTRRKIGHEHPKEGK